MTLFAVLAWQAHPRTCDKTVLKYQDERDRPLMSRRVELALPSNSNSVLYGLTSTRLLFAKPMVLSDRSRVCCPPLCRKSYSLSHSVDLASARANEYQTQERHD